MKEKEWWENNEKDTDFLDEQINKENNKKSSKKSSKKGGDKKENNTYFRVLRGHNEVGTKIWEAGLFLAETLLLSNINNLFIFTVPHILLS
jgi:hypothetical protein